MLCRIQTEKHGSSTEKEAIRDTGEIRKAFLRELVSGVGFEGDQRFGERQEYRKRARVLGSNRASQGGRIEKPHTRVLTDTAPW